MRNYKQDIFLQKTTKIFFNVTFLCRIYGNCTFSGQEREDKSVSNIPNYQLRLNWNPAQSDKTCHKKFLFRWFWDLKSWNPNDKALVSSGIQEIPVNDRTTSNIGTWICTHLHLNVCHDRKYLLIFHSGFFISSWKSQADICPDYQYLFLNISIWSSTQVGVEEIGRSPCQKVEISRK